MVPRFLPMEKSLHQLPTTFNAREEHRAMADWDVAFAQAAISGLFAATARSVGKVAAFLAEPQ
jgi:hypothetical protein